jgi:hypothetical protein
MSIEERLHSGLAANTDHLGSEMGLERELTTVLRRAHRRSQARVAGVALAGVAAALVAVAWLGDGFGLDRGDGPPDPIRTPRVTEVVPKSMEGVDGALEAGSWIVPLYGDE